MKDVNADETEEGRKLRQASLQCYSIALSYYIHGRCINDREPRLPQKCFVGTLQVSSPVLQLLRVVR